MFLFLLLGVGTQQFLVCYMPSLPYTAVLLCEGVVIGVIAMATDGSSSATEQKLHLSLMMWMEIDPHLLLFTFLPALLFGDAMKINTHLFSKCFTQCLLVACPGVLLGTFLTGCVAKYLLPYGWNWSLSLVLGSILAATDPVAVVALLKSLGASPVLTMQITGESLMNDGTAIVLFNLFFNMYNGQSYTPLGIVTYFVRMAVGGPALGLVFGLVTLLWMRRLSCSTSRTDVLLQIVLTLCCAYGSFFVGEELCQVSGVLCTVTAALVLAEYVWPTIGIGMECSR